MSGMSVVAPEELFALEEKPTAQLIADHLREQIVQGSIRPGQQINEYVLASQLNMSRSPVRKQYSVCAKKGSSSIGAITECSCPKSRGTT
ncbi:GntR family transcriptional regulator [Arthrobacter sp. SA17]